MITQEEKEKVMAVVYDYTITFNKLESAQKQIDALMENVNKTERELHEIRERETTLISGLREKYGEDVITADYLFNELKK
jgi:hypothetical protein